MANETRPPRRIIDLDERELADLVGAVVDERLASMRAKPVARLLDRSALAEALSVSEKTVDRLTSVGVPCVRLIEAKRFELDRSLEWLRARGQSPGLRVVQGSGSAPRRAGFDTGSLAGHGAPTEGRSNGRVGHHPDRLHGRRPHLIVQQVEPATPSRLWCRCGLRCARRNRRKAVGTMAAWSTECRLNAMAEMCTQGCDDLITDMLIEAESDANEKLGLVRVRKDKNTEALSAALKYIDKVKKFVAHAKALAAIPRGDVGCVARMVKDFKTIDALEAELDQISATVHGFAVIPTRGALGYAKSCVDCSDDRRLCADMIDSLKTSDETVAEARTLIQKDTATLAAKRVPAPARP